MSWQEMQAILPKEPKGHFTPSVGRVERMFAPNAMPEEEKGYSYVGFHGWASQRWLVEVEMTHCDCKDISCDPSQIH